MRIKLFNQVHEELNLTKMSEAEFKITIDKIKKILEEYKFGILDNLQYNVKTNKVEYKDFENINVEDIVDQLNTEIGKDIVDQFNIDTFLSNVQRSTWRTHGGVIGLNIGKNADTPIERAADDYLIGLAGVYPHADYITVNISSPNTKNLRALQGEQELDELLLQLAHRRQELATQYQRRVPLAVKIAPDLTEEQIDIITEVLPRHGIDGVIATNTTIARDAVQGLAHAQEAGGLSGAPLHTRSLEVIARLRAKLGPDFAIIGVGGIVSGKHAAEKISAGANAVQLYTGLIYKGPALVGECVREIAKLGK